MHTDILRCCQEGDFVSEAATSGCIAGSDVSTADSSGSWLRAAQRQRSTSGRSRAFRRNRGLAAHNPGKPFSQGSAPSAPELPCTVLARSTDSTQFPTTPSVSVVSSEAAMASMHFGALPQLAAPEARRFRPVSAPASRAASVAAPSTVSSLFVPGLPNELHLDYSKFGLPVPNQASRTLREPRPYPRSMELGGAVTCYDDTLAPNWTGAASRSGSRQQRPSSATSSRSFALQASCREHRQAGSAPTPDLVVDFVTAAKANVKRRPKSASAVMAAEQLRPRSAASAPPAIIIAAAAPNAQTQTLAVEPRPTSAPSSSMALTLASDRASAKLLVEHSLGLQRCTQKRVESNWKAYAMV